VWKVIDDVDRYAERVPMMYRVKRTGDRAAIDLKFEILRFELGPLDDGAPSGRAERERIASARAVPTRFIADCERVALCKQSSDRRGRKTDALSQR
jgi:hypothetical protein